MNNNNMLLIDCCGANFLEMDMHESTTPGGLVKFRGKFQEAEAVNKNKRMYPYGVLDENLQRLMECVDDRRLVGELDHPTDSIIHFANASHVVTKLWWEGNTLMGEGEILNTPHGKVLKALINDGIKVGISSRGVGNGKVNEDGILVIGESYKLITFDAVADPSTFSAFQEKVVGNGQRESVVRTQESAPQKSHKSNSSQIKNEGSRIDTVNKELLIACLGGVIESQTEKFKSRLG